MSAVSDRARYFLEQSVSELQELERKDIFTAQEIKLVARKRAEFEHKLNARGSRPADFARYAEYEMNFDSLRRRRAQRLQIRHLDHDSRRRIFLLLDRGTRKHHGDMGLWMQYVGYARSQKSYNRVAEILTRLVRLHPTSPALWIFAANHALDDWQDIVEARRYLQRGLRFCKSSKDIWLEYAKLEMMNISRIVASGHRQRQGTLDQHPTTSSPSIIMHDKEASQFRESVPVFSFESQAVNPKSTSMSESMDPVLSGAIPKALFDAAMKQFNGNATLGLEFFDMILQHDIPMKQHLLNYILDHPSLKASDNADILLRSVQLPLIGIASESADFPLFLRLALDTMDSILDRLGPSQTRTDFCSVVIAWLLQTAVETMDVDVRKAIELTAQKLQGMV